MKTVWVVGGGIMQMPMIERLVTEGYWPVITDGNPECPARWLRLGEFHCLSTYDIAGHRELARLLRPRFQWAGVLTVAADVGPTVSAVAEELDLPACSFQAALQARDKIAVRERLGAAHPRYLVLRPDETPTEAQIDQLWRKGVGIAVKAPRNRASRGFSLVQKREELGEAIARARQAADGEEILIEEGLTGPEIAVDMMVDGGVAQVINVADRRFLRPGLEIGHVNPGPELGEATVRMLQMAALSLDVNCGPFKADLINDPEYGWVILETATRLSGGFDHMRTAVLGPGKDITGLMIAFATGQPLNWQCVRVRRSLFCAARAPMWPPGKIMGYHWSKEYREGEDFEILSHDVIWPLITPADRPLFAFGIGQTAEEAWQIAGEILEEIRPIYR